MEFKIKKIKDLKDGDIFYATFSEIEEENNEHNFDIHSDLTGIDQIFIIDDVGGNLDKYGFQELYVNGGYVYCFHRNKKVKVLGHYSNLID
tara:strand:+ start:243 stop:515 length:273 start_codon:yes stop_codon:yes gene_type:complete